MDSFGRYGSKISKPNVYLLFGCEMGIYLSHRKKNATWLCYSIGSRKQIWLSMIGGLHRHTLLRQLWKVWAIIKPRYSPINMLLCFSNTLALRSRRRAVHNLDNISQTVSPKLVFVLMQCSLQTIASTKSLLWWFSSNIEFSYPRSYQRDLQTNPSRSPHRSDLDWTFIYRAESSWR